MIRPWQLPLVAAVCILASRSPVAAQTVVVRHVPAQTAVQVIVGDAAPVDAAPDATGNFRATVNAIPADATELSALVFVDMCQANLRVVMASRDSIPPSPGAGCTRRPISGTYVVRSRTGLVVDVAGPSPTLLTSQGPVPSQWLRDVVVDSRTPAAGGQTSAPAENYLPMGLMVFGTGDLGHYSKFGDADCGNSVGQCTVDKTVLAGTVGVEYWPTRYVGAFGSYSKGRDATTNGSGTGYSFSSQLATDFATIGGEARASASRLTLFGMLGATHHRATWTTKNTIADTTVTVDSGTQTLTGGTQTNIVKTQGWDVAFGAGADVWLTKRVGIRGGFDYAFFKGNDLGTSAASLDDSMLSVKVGVIVKIGKL